jgi:hypothetical protein
MITGRLVHPPTAHVEIPDADVADFCQRWGIAELALFGSVLRSDFGPESDVNVLVEFEPNVRHGIMDLMQMEEELKGIFHRGVMIVTRRGLERSRNADRRAEVLHAAEVIYDRR